MRTPESKEEKKSIKSSSKLKPTQHLLSIFEDHCRKMTLNKAKGWYALEGPNCICVLDWFAFGSGIWGPGLNSIWARDQIAEETELDLGWERKTKKTWKFYWKCNILTNVTTIVANLKNTCLTSFKDKNIRYISFSSNYYTIANLAHRVFDPC